MFGPRVSESTYPHRKGLIFRIGELTLPPPVIAFLGANQFLKGELGGLGTRWLPMRLATLPFTFYYPPPEVHLKMLN